MHLPWSLGSGIFARCIFLCLLTIHLCPVDDCTMVACTVHTTRSNWAGIPRLHSINTPTFDKRGLQPFHDFASGPDWWSEDDYKSILSQMAKAKMNFLGLHTYASAQRYASACGSACVWRFCGAFCSIVSAGLFVPFRLPNVILRPCAPLHTG